MGKGPPYVPLLSCHHLDTLRNVTPHSGASVLLCSVQVLRLDYSAVAHNRGQSRAKDGANIVLMTLPQGHLPGAPRRQMAYSTVGERAMGQTVSSFK